MPKDTTTPEAEQAQENSETEETEAKEDSKEDSKAEESKGEQDDYRSKLNATNRFLEREGYEFKGNKWVKNQEEKPAQKESKKDEDLLSYRDHYALSDAKVHVDDVDYVVKESRIRGKSIAVTLKDEEVQAVLKLRGEKRNSADAANTKPARGGAKKPDGEQLNRELSQGKVPEPGSEEAEELFWARRGGRPK